MSCFELELTSIGHGIPGVQDQIYDYLLDLGRIGLYNASFPRDEVVKLDVLANHAPEHLRKVFNKRIQIEVGRLHHLPSGQHEKLLSKARGALCSLLHGLDASLDFRRR